MKNKYSINFIAAIILTLVNFNLPGQKRQTEMPILESMQLPIMTWYGLTPDQLDLAHFKELADAGFTIMNGREPVKNNCSSDTWISCTYPFHFCS
jgi:hypothetical protein